MIEYEGEMLDEVERALDELGGYSTLLIVRDGRTVLRASIVVLDGE